MCLQVVSFASITNPQRRLRVPHRRFHELIVIATLSPPSPAFLEFNSCQIFFQPTTSALMDSQSLSCTHIARFVRSAAIAQRGCSKLLLMDMTLCPISDPANGPADPSLHTYVVPENINDMRCDILYIRRIVRVWHARLFVCDLHQRVSRSRGVQPRAFPSRPCVSGSSRTGQAIPEALSPEPSSEYAGAPIALHHTLLSGLCFALIGFPKRHQQDQQHHHLQGRPAYAAAVMLQ